MGVPPGIVSLETFCVTVTDIEKGFKMSILINTIFFDSLSSKNELKTKGNKIRFIKIGKDTSKVDGVLI